MDLKSLIAEFKAKAAEYGNNPTDEQINDLTSRKAAIEEAVKAANRAKEVKDNASFIDSLKSLEGGDEEDNTDNGGGVKAKSLGEFFVKAAGESRLNNLAATNGTAITDLPEFTPAKSDGVRAKAASDPFSATSLGENYIAGWGTQYQRDIVNARRERLVIADLMPNLQVTASTIKYLVEKSKRIAEGGFATVAEGAKKPYVRFDNFDIVTESLSKIAGLTKLTDEMVEDHDFMAAWINTQLLYELSVAEESQLLNGDGAGSNLTGLLNRSGLQTMEAASAAELPDTIYKANTAISLATPLTGDAVLINPADYQNIRLTKDANGQYMGGGYFTGPYGNGGVMVDPPLWGMRTVQTQAVPVGTVVVGAFRQGATILRKGGVRVDSTRTNVDDFENNLVTFRAEERLGLMVQHPAAFVKVNVTTEPAE